MMPITPSRSKQAQQRYRVLCVDDNEFGLFVNTIILRNQGYDVVACTDVVKAAAIASSEEIDLAILDYQMPVMNGAELAAICKAANPDMKVILYSGSVGMPKWELALADLFIAKADGIEALLEGIAALLLTDGTLTAVPTTATIA